MCAVLALSGCGLLGRESGRSAATLRADLTARLAELRAAQASALDLWTRVIDGETVACQETIPVPEAFALTAGEGKAVPAAATAVALLDEARRSLQDAAALWDIECADERPAVPLEVARQGRASALAAATSLDQADALLAVWPGS
jgi:hypothetical protein